MGNRGKSVPIRITSTADGGKGYEKNGQDCFYSFF